MKHLQHLQPCVCACLHTCTTVRVCLNLHLSQYPSITSPDQVKACTGHPMFLIVVNLMQEWRKNSTSPAVTRYSVFFWLLIFHMSPLIVSWRSLSLYLIIVWLCFPSLTAQSCYCMSNVNLFSTVYIYTTFILPRKTIEEASSFAMVLRKNKKQETHKNNVCK